MKIWVYVEGESDRLALQALWDQWISELRSKGCGLRTIKLDTKDKFLRKIGPLAAEKLVHGPEDLVIGLPDFYPNAPYAETTRKHETVQELQELQRSAVAKDLERIFGLRGHRLDQAMKRFWPSALKHDLEMLLLAAKEQLRQVIGTKDRLGRWSLPVEDQDQIRPPKRIVEELFRTKRPMKRAYRDTKDAPAVLKKVEYVPDLLFTSGGKLNCPVFKSVLDWVGEITGVPAYS